MKRFLIGFLVVVLAIGAAFALIRDRNIEWRRARKYISVSQMTGLVAQNSVDTGAPVIAEIGILGYTALTMNTAGDLISHAMPLPREIDVTRPIYFRTHWTILGTGHIAGAVTGTEEVTWVVTYDETGGTTSEVGRLEVADSALSTTIEADVYIGTTTYEVWHVSPWGTLDANTLDAARFLSLRVEMDKAQYGTVGRSLTQAPVGLLGLEMEYTPKQTAGGGRLQESAR